MATSSIDLPKFLSWRKEQSLAYIHSAEPTSRLMLIMGNEAGDLDSAASAIAMSYLLTYYPEFGSQFGFHRETMYAPLIQTPRTSLSQRRENLMVYDALNIPIDSLLCVDDLGVDPQLSDKHSLQGHMTFGIVDHARLGPEWGDNKPVELIVDHHEDENAHETARLRIVRSPSNDPVGSCSSIVANLFEQAAKQSDQRINRDVADLLLSAILLDTKNLRMAPSGKATPTDAAAYTYLLPQSSFRFFEPNRFHEAAQRYGVGSVTGMDAEPNDPGSVAPGASREAEEHTRDWAYALRTVKMRVDHLASNDLLARDFKATWINTAKQRQMLGLASVPISLISWVTGSYATNTFSEDTSKDIAEEQWKEWWKSVNQFRISKRLDILVVLCSYSDSQSGKSRRDFVLVYATNEQNQSSFSQVLEQLVMHPNPSLDLTPYVSPRIVDGLPEHAFGLTTDDRIDEHVHAAVFAQGNTKANRKVVQPVMVDVLGSIY